MNNQTQGHQNDKISAYASGSGSLSFVVRDENRNPVSGRHPTADECVAYIKDKLQNGQGTWAEGHDWMIINQGPLDRANHEIFEAVQKVERLDSNKLLYHGKEYTYDPEKIAGTITPLFTTTVGGHQIEVEGTGNNGALGYFLKNERVLTNPSRIVWESNQKQQSTENVLEPTAAQKSREIIDMDAPGALHHVFKYVGTLVDGDRPSKNAADWEKVGSYTEGVIADKVAAKLCEQGHFSKIQSVGEYSPELRYVLNDYSPSEEAYFKAHPNEGIKVSQSRYAVVLVLESGKRINYFDFADDAKHAEGLAIASQSEQVLETVSVQLASLYQEFKAAGIEIHNHESDMYVPITRETTAILENYPIQKVNATKFKSNIDGVSTYDIPFSFDPFYEQSMKRQSIVEARYIACEKVSFDEIDLSVDKTYEGRVMGVTDAHVVLSLGRNALIVAKSDLDRLPVKGESVTLSIKEGKVVVLPAKEKNLTHGR